MKAKNLWNEEKIFVQNEIEFTIITNYDVWMKLW